MISIIGNTGIVGSGIELYLSKKKLKIFTFSRNKKISDNKIDLLNDNYLNNSILLNSDYIIFCAGIINECLDSKLIKKKKNNFLKFLKKYKGKIIYISSSHVYGNKDKLINEKKKIIIKNVYSKIHIVFENLVLSHNGYIIRANTVYGLYKNNNLRLSLIPYSFIISSYFENKIFIKSKINFKRNFISNLAIGKMCYLIIKQKVKKNLINIVGNNDLTLYQYALLVKQMFKKFNKDITIKKNFVKKNNFKFRSILKITFDTKNDLKRFVKKYIIFLKNNEKKFKNFEY